VGPELAGKVGPEQAGGITPALTGWPSGRRARASARTFTGSGLASRRPVYSQNRALLVVWLVAVVVLLAGPAAHAETVHVVALAARVDDVLNNIRTWIMSILGGVALVFLTLGGLRYLMGSGDPGEIEKAKGAVKAAGIGFGLAALAPLIVEILKSIVGGV
jgi:hypothetical protein